MTDLEWLQEWFAARCDGEWEHDHGVRIDTLDNPGWLVELDAGAGLDDQTVERERSELDWIACRIDDGKFRGYGGPGNLVEILGTLRAWLG